MSDSRIYLDAPLEQGGSVALPEGPFRHLVQVLRMQAGDALIVFNGQGGEYEAQIETVTKRGATLSVGVFHDADRESPLHVTLVQGISKGDRMDWAIQKAVELGVSAIVPVLTERCNVNLDRERQDKKLDHWRGVVISACEQSGRTRLPSLAAPLRLSDWWRESAGTATRYLLDPQGSMPLALAPQSTQGCTLVVGPEGGLSAAEIRVGAEAGCIRVRMGPRILRTETAGVAALAMLQGLAGDLR